LAVAPTSGLLTAKSYARDALAVTAVESGWKEKAHSLPLRVVTTVRRAPMDSTRPATPGRMWPRKDDGLTPELSHAAHDAADTLPARVEVSARARCSCTSVGFMFRKRGRAA